MLRLLQWYDVGASACCLGITTADTQMGLVFTSINTPEVEVPAKKLGVIVGNRQAPPVVNPPTQMGLLVGNKQIPKVIVPKKKNGFVLGNVQFAMVKPKLQLPGFLFGLVREKPVIKITVPQRVGFEYGLPQPLRRVKYESNTGRVQVNGSSYRLASYMVTSSGGVLVGGSSVQQAIVTYNSQAVVKVNGSSNIISPLGYTSLGGVLVGGSSAFTDI